MKGSGQIFSQNAHPCGYRLSGNVETIEDLSRNGLKYRIR